MAKINSDGLSKRKIKNAVFYSVMMAWPIFQFIVFYIGVNFNSIILAFKDYNNETRVYEFAGFANLKIVIDRITRDPNMLIYLRNSILFYIIGIFGTLLALLFSYYIYKKMTGYKFFILVLYLPSIISPIVLSIIFRYLVDRAMPDIFKDYFHKEILGLFVGGKTMMPTLIFYNIFLSFGVNVLMYSSAMSSIDDSVIESASLDGVTPIREFWSIVVPLIFPTLATFLVVGVAAMFTDQAQLFALFGAESCPEQLYTVGYYLYSNTYLAVAYATDGSYPLLSAYGVVLTIVAVPLTLVVKWLLNKFGPSAE